MFKYICMTTRCQNHKVCMDQAGCCTLCRSVLCPYKPKTFFCLNCNNLFDEIIVGQRFCMDVLCDEGIRLNSSAVSPFLPPLGINNAMQAGPSPSYQAGVAAHEKPVAQVRPSDLGVRCTCCATIFHDHKVLEAHHNTLLQGCVQKGYYCYYCAKQFQYSSDLQRHVLTHTGEKPYVCNVCNKRFSQASNLTRHMTIHQKKTLGR